MKIHVSKRHTTFAIFLILFAQMIFATNMFSPIIQNYGEYKILNATQKDTLYPLLGHVPADVGESTKLEPMANEHILKLSVVLPLNNESELDQKLLDITNPQSPNFRKFLSQAEFVEQYGPTKEQVNAVHSYLANNGFTLESVDENRLIINVSAPVGVINDIFNTEIHYFEDQSGKQFYAPLYELQIDNALNIHSVHGLENRFKAHPNFQVLQTLKDSTMAAPKAGRGLAPADIKKAYSLSSSLNGSGQVLALFELDGFTQSDITAYENAYNLPHVKIDTVLVGGATGVPSDGAGEVTLDIELMIALAPGVSKIIVYEGINSASGVLATYNRIANDNSAKSVSTSWGAPETSSGGSFVGAENTIFKQMAAQGQSFYAASGDSGAYDNGTKLSVDDPASQPFAVGVGGTTLKTNTDGSYNNEKTWSNGNGPGYNGGGGGISLVWSIPLWQKPVINSNSRGSLTMRNVPDVALDADPQTGYAIYFNGQWQIFGGTSCAAPLWAAFTALVNQDLVSKGKSVVGFPNPTFYQLGQDQKYALTFHDIKDNSTNGYYPAVEKFDLATGWGTFYGDQLISFLTGSTNTPPPSCVQANPALSITPSTQSGIAGTALVYSVSITNNDSSNCAGSNFNLSAVLPSGFTSSFAQNTLSIPAGQTGSVPLTITSLSTLTPGNYNLSVTAVNANNVSLTGSGSFVYGVENSQGSNLALTVTPKSGTLFSRYLLKFATFEIALTNNYLPIANNPIDIVVSGPKSWTNRYKTDQNGLNNYLIFISPFLPVGQYHITVSSSYQGKTVSGQTAFTIE